MSGAASVQRLATTVSGRMSAHMLLRGRAGRQNGTANWEAEVQRQLLKHAMIMSAFRVVAQPVLRQREPAKRGSVTVTAVAVRQQRAPGMVLLGRPRNHLSQHGFELSPLQMQTMRN